MAENNQLYSVKIEMSVPKKEIADGMLEKIGDQFRGSKGVLSKIDKPFEVIYKGCVATVTVKSEKEPLKIHKPINTEEIIEEEWISKEINGKQYLTRMSRL